ncbi:ROK family protein [Solwaraspora sp. WMMA2080]|uniref:ROK family protein n=1 Tax=unclassified Solwaraspora TaxID=2627926 RepID=UPI00248CF85A|nr:MULTISPECIES: ROK family protein [unclassified Solwaraspora]WBB96442.1 ROK family protein [Solwaraspora sp. WMMA2059]WBC19652.1 ROK family protein [Solwaraspora sp. WMMA2080]
MISTLAIDCGGGGIKASVLDEAGTMRARPLRVPTPYPLPPKRFVDTLRGLRDQLPAADRVTVGMPGMIRHGVVVATPHYVTKAGPRTKVDPGLLAEWSGFDARTALGAAFDLPVLVLNDAEVHGAGVVAGAGCELVLTLGTGLGCALFDGGRLAPHLELSQAPVRWGQSYDTYVGEHERRRLGDAFWSRRVRGVVDGLRPVFCWDRLYLGGGNSRLIRPEQVARMGDDVVVVPNTAGIVGGVRAWTLIRP